MPMDCSTAKYYSHDRKSYSCPESFIPHTLTNWANSPSPAIIDYIAPIYERYIYIYIYLLVVLRPSNIYNTYVYTIILYGWLFNGRTVEKGGFAVIISDYGCNGVTKGIKSQWFRRNRDGWQLCNSLHLHEAVWVVCVRRGVSGGGGAGKGTQNPNKPKAVYPPVRSRSDSMTRLIAE